MEIDKFLFALDLRTGALAEGGLQIILGPILYIHGIPSTFLYDFLTGVSIFFVYFLISLIAGLFLICGHFLYNPLYVLIHQIATAIGTLLFFSSFVMTSVRVQVMQDNLPEDEIGIIYIIPVKLSEDVHFIVSFNDIC